MPSTSVARERGCQEIAQPRAGHEQYAEARGCQNHSGTEIGLEKQQPGSHPNDRHRLQEAFEAAGKVRGATHRVARKIEEQAEARGLGCLQRERTHRQPPRAAVHRVADARHENEQQQAERDDQQKPIQAIPQLARQRDHDRHRDQSETESAQMAEQEIQRLAHLAIRKRDRSGTDHDRAKDGERDHGADQHRIERKGRCTRNRNGAHEGSSAAARANCSPRSL